MVNHYLKTFPQFILPKRLLTQCAGLLANIETPSIKNQLIRYFIQKYAVNMLEAQEENPENYPSFNDFFIRHLKPESRPIAQADIVSPIDGSISEIGFIKQGQLLQAKGFHYTVKQLLAGENIECEPFERGRFATFYLSPKDYHRVHMPIDATLKKMIYVPGQLFSVQPTTARVIPRLFARNERLIAFFDTKIGLMAMVLVGAVIVGAIGTRWEGEIKRSRKKQYFSYENKDTFVHQGDEMGYFKLGSTVILLFADECNIQWNRDLKAGDCIRYGEDLAAIET